MLVLSRKLSQQITIGSSITITILKVKGNTVRVGIEAPRDVRIIRAELPSDEHSEAADSGTVSCGASRESRSRELPNSTLPPRARHRPSANHRIRLALPLARVDEWVVRPR